jgi:transposase-like protein
MLMEVVQRDFLLERRARRGEGREEKVDVFEQEKRKSRVHGSRFEPGA